MDLSTFEIIDPDTNKGVVDVLKEKTSKNDIIMVEGAYFSYLFEDNLKKNLSDRNI